MESNHNSRPSFEDGSQISIWRGFEVHQEIDQIILSLQSRPTEKFASRQQPFFRCLEFRDQVLLELQEMGGRSFRFTIKSLARPQSEWKREPEGVTLPFLARGEDEEKFYMVEFFVSRLGVSAYGYDTEESDGRHLILKEDKILRRMFSDWMRLTAYDGRKTESAS